MRKLLSAIAIIGLATPAMAQTQQPQTAPAAEQKTVTKIVCERVSDEQVTGSRLGAAPKKCRKVEVPVESTGKQSQKSHAPSHSGH